AFAIASTWFSVGRGGRPPLVRGLLFSISFNLCLLIGWPATVIRSATAWSDRPAAARFSRSQSPKVFGFCSINLLGRNARTDPIKHVHHPNFSPVSLGKRAPHAPWERAIAKIRLRSAPC